MFVLILGRNIAERVGEPAIERLDCVDVYGWQVREGSDISTVRASQECVTPQKHKGKTNVIKIPIRFIRMHP
ncbi:hypothetical protein JT359_02315 [Candidatus Poribacteria bacterium]|nr:hypothetical protein [Candidatus Poribacteria bacterium]